MEFPDAIKKLSEMDCSPIVFNSYKERLKTTLSDLIAFDTVYEIRYHLVIKAMYLADSCGYPTGIRIDPDESEWPVVFIELPNAQISWHLSAHPLKWDGHTTEEKFERIRKFINT
jgi:hypothetical protein